MRVAFGVILLHLMEVSTIAFRARKYLASSDLFDSKFIFQVYQMEDHVHV